VCLSRYKVCQSKGEEDEKQAREVHGAGN